MKTILVVDDDISILRLIRIALKKEGYAIETARDGREALEKLKELTPDLIITDVMMPVVGGLELVRALKQKLPLKKIPVIVLTSLKHYDDMRAGYEFGADLYITKPFDIEELASAVNELLTGEIKT